MLTSHTSEPVSSYILSLLPKFHDEMYIHWIGRQEVLEGLHVVRWRGLLSATVPWKVTHFIGLFGPEGVLCQFLNVELGRHLG